MLEKLRHPLVLLFLALLAILPPRLRDLDAPLLGAHAWRQTHTADVARNFFRRGMDILTPEVSYRGATPRACEQEFPLYTWLVALGYELRGGVDERLGRLLSVVFSLGTAAYLFLIGRDLWGDGAAVLVVLVYGYFPLDLVFHRAFLPDNAMVTFSVGLLYHFRRWLDGERPRELALAIGMGTLAFLCKIPTVYLGLPLLWLCIEKWGLACFRRGTLWAVATAMLVPSILWYGHAHGHPVQFGMWNLGAANWGKSAVWTSSQYWATMWYFLHNVVLTEGGLALVFAGLFVPLRERERFLVPWALAIGVYYLVVAEGNMRHSYYHLPTCALGALLVVRPVARFLERLEGGARPAVRRLASLGVLVVLLAFVNLSEERARRTGQMQMQFHQLLPCAEALARKSAPADAIVSHYPHGEPELCYYADRCGWQMLWHASHGADLRRFFDGGARWIAYLYPPAGEEGRFYVPVRILENLERAGLSGNVFYDRGMYGYLIERLEEGHPLFKPGNEKLRYAEYAAALHRLVLRGDDRFEEFLDRCDFEIFILYSLNPASHALRRRIAARGDFVLVDSDGFNQCWVRRKPRWKEKLPSLDLAPVNFELDPLARGLPRERAPRNDGTLLAKEARLEKLLAGNPEAPSLLLYLANVEAALGKPEAESRFAELCRMNEGVGSLLMADYLVTLGERPREAFPWFLRAEKHQPENAAIPFKMALCHIRLGERAAARVQLAKALKLNPRMGKAWAVLAGIALEERLWDEARRHMANAEALGEDVSRMRAFLGER